MNEDSLAAVLYGREPPWFQGDLRALDVGLVLPMDVRCHGFEAREAGQRQDLAQAVELDDGLNAVTALRAAPGPIG